MPSTARSQPTVADEVRRVEVDLERRRFLALVDIGVTRELTVAELAAGLPSEESALLARVLGAIPATGLRQWFDGDGAGHLTAVLGAPPPAKKKSARNGTSRGKKRRREQANLPGMGGDRTKPETLAFDRQVVQLVAKCPDGAKAGDLKGQLTKAMQAESDDPDVSCSRGKLRLSLERCKSKHWISQKGTLNGSRYFVTGTGLEFAEAKPKTQEN